MCVAVDGAPDRTDPPRFDRVRPPTSPPPPGQRRDAGQPGLDAGPADGGLDGDAGLGPRDGGAEQCLPGQALCTGGCANLSNDPNNCGACGIACPQGQDCNRGVCCDASRTLCGDRCVDVFSDRNHCGVCGFVCELGASCVVGQCTPDDIPPALGGGGPPGF